MRAPHLLCVDQAPEAFSSLFNAAEEHGLRLGWLELETGAAFASPGLEELCSAAQQGALRAVAVEAGQAVVIKPRRGAPVLRDLLREHFLGCALVLVRRGSESEVAVEAPTLQAEGESFRIVGAHGSSEREPSASDERLDARELAARLRSSRPW